MTDLYIFTYEESSMIYGIGTYINELKQGLKANEKIKVHIVHLFSNDYNELTKLYKDNFCHIFIPSPIYCENIINGYKRDLEKYSSRIVNLLLPFLNSHNQAVFLMNLPYFYYIAKELKRSTSCKIITTLHFIDWKLRLNGNYTQFKNIWDKQEEQGSNSLSILEQSKLEKNICQISDKVICVTKSAKDYLVNTYDISEDKIEVIYNGLSLNSQIKVDLKEKEKLKMELGFHKSERIILYCGRVTSGKGVEFLIQAFRNVLKFQHNCKLILVGGGNFSEYTTYCKGIWDKVIFTGFLEKEDLYKFYQVADIGVIPSLHEQCSYVAIEMMHFELPIVTTNAEGLNEIINEKIGCYIVNLCSDSSGNIYIKLPELEKKIVEALLLKPKRFKYDLSKFNREYMCSRITEVISK